MNSNQLHSLLVNSNNNPALDWQQIKTTYNPETIEINGQPVYVFNMSFDFSNTPIEDNIVVYHQLPYAYVPMHVHEFIELIYVYEGHCTVVLQEGEIEVAEGGIIIIDKQTPHTVKDNTKSDIIVDIKLKHDYFSTGFLSRFANKSIISQFLVGSLMDKRKANNYLYFPLEDGSKYRIL